MNTTIKNIAKTTSNSFTDCKWNDIVVFSSNAKVTQQLEGYVRTQYNNVQHKNTYFTIYTFPKAVEDFKKSLAAFFMCLTKINIKNLVV